MARLKFNTTLILLSIILLTAIATWLIPAGKYEKEVINGKAVLVEGSFHYIESSPQSVFDMLKAPMEAFGRSTAASIMAFLLIISGSFMIIEKTGAITAAIKRAGLIFSKNPSWRKFYIPTTMLLFSIGGATFGMSEEVLIFIPIFIPLSISLKYDSAIGVAV
ncbi:MAG: YfcC family protein, partial [Elusimicrobiota bacterium]|nr:YfcC family protein [Elusimicrobiota bacterium]